MKKLTIEQEKLLEFWKIKMEKHFNRFPDGITTITLYSDTVDILNPQFKQYLQDHSIILTEDKMFPGTPFYTGRQSELIPMMIIWYDIKDYLGNEIDDLMQWRYDGFNDPMLKTLGTNFGSNFINK